MPIVDASLRPRPETASAWSSSDARTSGAAGSDVWPPRYRRVISLGYFCSTALELQRYGLRDGSYPLDWNISPIEPTLSMIASGFHGFLELENLEPQDGRVYDSGSGIFVYNSFDLARPIPEQYDEVRRRYDRRIERFAQAITRPTLFVRYIDGPDEFDFLDANMDTVLDVLRRSNPHNDLVLLGNAGLPPVCGGLACYAVEPDAGDGVARRFLEKNPELRARLLHLHYPVGLRICNIARYWHMRQLRRLRAALRLRTRVRGAGG